MKIAHVNTYDVTGGAARAAYRLHRGLIEAGTDSVMFVRDKASSDPAVRSLASIGATLRSYANNAVALPYRDRTGVFTAAPAPDPVIRRVAAWDPDVVHLHWLGEGFVAPGGLRRARRPIVWTLHDAYAFTGGCHYPIDCRRYAERCGACGALGSSWERDLSRVVWSRKRRAWGALDLTVVAPSRWMAECARGSSLFRDRRIEVIPYGLDLDQFRPIPREVAREVLRLPRDRRYVLFTAMGGASNPLKGFVHLAEALQRLGARAAGVELLLGGASRPPDVAPGVPVRCLGQLHDDVSIALLNSAADVVAVPSTQDNLPNTALEALACGRPVAAFRIGGLPDLVEDRVNGALVEPFDAAALGDRIAWMLEDDARWRELSNGARRAAEARYSLRAQAARYGDLYRELTAPGRVRTAVAPAT